MKNNIIKSIDEGGEVILETTDTTVIIDGKEYPPTRHNLDVWKEYKKTKNKKVLNRLSTIILDI